MEFEVQKRFARAAYEAGKRGGFPLLEFVQAEIQGLTPDEFGALLGLAAAFTSLEEKGYPKEKELYDNMIPQILRINPPIENAIAE